MKKYSLAKLLQITFILAAFAPGVMVLTAPTAVEAAETGAGYCNAPQGQEFCCQCVAGQGTCWENPGGGGTTHCSPTICPYWEPPCWGVN